MTEYKKWNKYNKWQIETKLKYYNGAFLVLHRWDVQYLNHRFFDTKENLTLINGWIQTSKNFQKLELYDYKLDLNYIK